jgi:hypothetical protein
VVVTDISISLVHNSTDSKGQKLLSNARQLHSGNLTQVPFFFFEKNTKILLIF